MIIKNKKIKGTTLLETIVASAIFLLILTISLEMINRIYIPDGNHHLYSEAEIEIKKHYKKTSEGFYESGQHIHDYEWGQISIDLNQYRDFIDIQEFVIKAEISKLKKKIEYRYLISKEMNDLQKEN